MIDLEIRASQFSNFLKSPQDLIDSIENPLEERIELVTGTLVHKAVLKGEKAYKDYINENLVTLEVSTRNNKTYIHKKKELADAGIDKFIILQKELDNIEKMCENVNNNDLIASLLIEPNHFVEKTFRKEIDGVKFKGTVDYISDDRLFDLKTIAKTKPTYRIKEYNYEIQLGLYCMLSGIDLSKAKCGFIFLHKDEPYNCETFIYDDDSMNVIIGEVKRLISLWKRFAENKLNVNFNSIERNITTRDTYFESTTKRINELECLYDKIKIT